MLINDYFRLNYHINLIETKYLPFLDKYGNEIHCFSLSNDKYNLFVSNQAKQELVSNLIFIPKSRKWFKDHKLERCSCGRGSYTLVNRTTNFVICQQCINGFQVIRPLDQTLTNIIQSESISNVDRMVLSRFRNESDCFQTYFQDSAGKKVL